MVNKTPITACMRRLSMTVENNAELRNDYHEDEMEKSLEC